MRKLGDFELHAVTDGTFRLDGGAMHGVVPKILWEKHSPPDDRNRIELALGCLLVKTPKGKWALIDTGLSDKYDKDPKFMKIYAVDRRRTLLDALSERGLAPTDISIVVNTHLHFDHCGGNTRWEGDSRPVPAFPKAQYFVQKAEWEDAHRPHERNQASYLPENFACLDGSGRLELVDGEFEIEKGFKVLRKGGHTRGHQVVLIEGDEHSALFLGDLIPTQAHVPLPWIMGYDLYPVDTLEAKRDLLGLAKANGWLLLFQHDPRQREGFLRDVEGRERIIPPEAPIR